MPRPKASAGVVGAGHPCCISETLEPPRQQLPAAASPSLSKEGTPYSHRSWRRWGYGEFS